MVHIQHMAEQHDPDAWVYEVENVCQQCGSQWVIDRHDEKVGGWRYLFGALRKPRVEVHGPGIAEIAQYMVKTYPAETGICGTFLVSRCPHCGAQSHTRAPDPREVE